MKYNLLRLDDFMISVIRPERLNRRTVTSLRLKSYLLVLDNEIELIKKQFVMVENISGNTQFKKYLQWHQTELLHHLEIVLYYFSMTRETESQYQHILVSFYNRVCYKVEELLAFSDTLLRESRIPTSTGSITTLPSSDIPHIKMAVTC